MQYKCQYSTTKLSEKVQYLLTEMCLLIFSLWVVIAMAESATAIEDDVKIIGGDPADIKDIPFQLSMRGARYNNHICAASIISNRWAVSAAHCCQMPNTTKRILVAGTSYLNKGGSVHPIVKMIKHPSYTTDQLDYDIAVLHVRKPFRLRSPGVNCITLASQPPPPDTLAQTSGWGVTREENLELPNQLRKVLVPIVDSRECKKVYPKQFTDGMICAGYKEGGKDACQADSGGPLVVNNQLVGIVSWGKGCGLPGYPGVYSRVDRFSEWVRKVTRISRC